MITDGQVPEKNKRLLVAFRSHLEELGQDEPLIDIQMSDVSLYVLDYTSECLNGSCVPSMNAFDVYCFLADYVIRKVHNCSTEVILSILGSLSAFVEYLAQISIIDDVDLYEILALCDDPGPYVLRCEEYRQLVRENDSLGLQRWRESILDSFTV